MLKNNLTGPIKELVGLSVTQWKTPKADFFATALLWFRYPKFSDKGTHTHTNKMLTCLANNGLRLFALCSDMNCEPTKCLPA